MIIVIILIAYMAAMLYIGTLGKKYSSNMSDFLTAGKKGTLPMVAGSFLGAQIGTGIVVGGAANGADYGIGAVWYGVGAACSFALFAIFVAKWAHKSECLTIPSYFRKRYPEVGKELTLICAILGICGATANIASQIIAGKQLFNYMGINPMIGSTVSMLIILVYCSVSGMWGVMMTDLWQVIIILIGMIAVLISLFCFHGGNTALASLGPDYFKAVPFDTETLLWMLLPTALYGLVSASAIQRAVSAKSEKVAVQGALIGAAGTGLITFFPVLIGMYGRAAFPEAHSSSILFMVIFNSLPTGLAGLMLAAIVAAVMSTCDTQIMSILAYSLHDTYTSVLVPKFNLSQDERRIKRYSNMITLLALVAAMLLSFKFNNIQKLLSYGLTLSISGSIIPFLGGRLMKKGTGIGAMASMFTAIIIVILNLSGTIHLLNSLIALIPAAVVYVLVSLFT